MIGCDSHVHVWVSSDNDLFATEIWTPATEIWTLATQCFMRLGKSRGALKVALMLNNRAQVVASRVVASYDIWPWRGYQSLATIHSAAFSLLTSLFQVAAIPRVLTSKLINSISIILRSENLRYLRTPS